jgi:mRNA interferase RelE/StbE
MASYRLVIKPSVEKDLEHLPSADVKRLFRRIEGLAFDPFPAGCVKLSGSERLYRIRQGRYRIVYEVSALERMLTIHYVRHRRDVYRRLR